ncbi:hypothetical protein C9374_004645 [Naegleria lovaniensis]|uniref:Acyl-coenzyme A thioesterase THEM4 n=1 Tax=Naegleria lovaniensis TaxID=51637 RepID=A0AA88GSF3_NAELO|nr:uncharacterized protein C9374_004645 [Naegleria lovaniensis]KAG2383308.1 hypothetical protein C9374_004645 [Naegleria lovaniensis]
MFGVKDPRVQEAKRMFRFTMEKISPTSDAHGLKEISLIKQMKADPERYHRLSWEFNFPKLVDVNIQKSLGRKGGAFAVYSIQRLMFWDKQENKIVGAVAFGIDCEGPPGCVHGGAIATALDEAFGWCCIRNIGFSGVTLNLSVNYFKFIPLKRAVVGLEIETERVEGKKVFMKGKLYNLDNPQEVHNTASALFYKANEHMPTWDEAVKLFGEDSKLAKDEILSYFKKRIKKKIQENQQKEAKNLDVQPQPGTEPSHRLSKL